ncbi:uncharacterized protein BYT42DRAFT_587887 [Radiomyces spectabilis]|uniref:uncharacterized protein n=1 Tax=Radiomyces spectabilis TaxID=64574 RepID=UPI00221F06CB|nr:uncharacterized protein BYT42DRAFT_587887 [Radiomyces spectabilis]KAI8366788.1 hypothetical protein BYT42DRAFT_587887 [Radiomyces spectabilis]
MVGRAKWDAWKKLEGMTTLEAKHRYVETLLRAATEAYKRNVGKAQAQQIIQVFAIMRPSGDDDDSDDDEDANSTDAGSVQDEESSIGSADAEEQAYLRDIQQSAGRLTPASLNKDEAYGSLDSHPPPRPPSRSMRSLASPRSATPRSPSIRAKRQSWHEGQPTLRAASVISAQSGRTSLVTAESSLSAARRPSRSLAVSPRPPSAASHDKRLHMISQRLGRVLPRESLFDENFDDTVNPWAQYPTQSNKDDAASTASARPSSAASGMATRTTSPPAQLTSSVFQSPIHGSSTSSSVTATASNVAAMNAGGLRSLSSGTDLRPPPQRFMENRSLADPQYTSVVALGPATKRALESLQSEVIALNDRIDELRQELINRDHRKMMRATSNHFTSTTDDSGSEDEEDEEEEAKVWDSWRWVIKAAGKHAAVNFFTALLLFFILYKRQSPIAYTILAQLSRVWRRFKLSILFTKVVV